MFSSEFMKYLIMYQKDDCIVKKQDKKFDYEYRNKRLDEIFGVKRKIVSIPVHID